MGRKGHSRRRSFSLIEIVVVIAILGVIAISSYLGITQQFRKVRDSRRKADLNILRNALEEYYDSRNCYLQSLPPCYSSLKLENSEFLSTIPCDPKTHLDYAYVSNGCECSDHYQLYTNLELTDDPIIDFVNCRYGCGPDCQYNYGVSSPNIDLEVCGPTQILYVCAPGGGKEGFCEAYDSPSLSQCPQVFPDDPTCNNACSVPANRCKNAAGKSVPEKKLVTPTPEC